MASGEGRGGKPRVFNGLAGREARGGKGPRGHRLLEFPERPGEIRLTGLPSSITAPRGTVREGSGGGEGEWKIPSLQLSQPPDLPSLVVLSVQIFF
jgi:hypothetical protein